MDNEFKIVGYAFAWNEEAVVPYVMEYWRKAVDKLYVFVYGVLDKTVEKLGEYSDFVEIIDYVSPETYFNKKLLASAKNNCWKVNKGKCDCSIVSDLACPPIALEGYDVREIIKNAFKQFSAVTFRMYHAYRMKGVDGITPEKYLNGKYTFFVRNDSNNNYFIFNPNTTEETNFEYVGSWKPNEAERADVYYGAIFVDFTHFQRDWSINRDIVADNFRTQKHTVKRLNDSYMLNLKRGVNLKEIPITEEENEDEQK